MQFEIVVLKLMKTVQCFEMDLVSWVIHWMTAWRHMSHIYIYTLFFLVQIFIRFQEEHLLLAKHCIFQ